MTREIIGNATLIYALTGEDGRVRYVGKTVQSLIGRFKQHRRDAVAARLPVHRWLAKTPDASVLLLEVVPSGKDWVARERYWIGQFDDLLNLTDGGEGLPGLRWPDDRRKKFSDSKKAGRYFTCEKCGNEFWRKPSQIHRGHARFCSRSCFSASIRGVSKEPSTQCRSAGLSALKRISLERGASTQCKRGHELSGDNVYLKRGSRTCRTCARMTKAARRRNVAVKEMEVNGEDR